MDGQEARLGAEELPEERSEDVTILLQFLYTTWYDLGTTSGVSQSTNTEEHGLVQAKQTQAHIDLPNQSTQASTSVAVDVNSEEPELDQSLIDSEYIHDVFDATPGFIYRLRERVVEYFAPRLGVLLKDETFTKGMRRIEGFTEGLLRRSVEVEERCKALLQSRWDDPRAEGSRAEGSFADVASDDEGLAAAIQASVNYW